LLPGFLNAAAATFSSIWPPCTYHGAASFIRSLTRYRLVLKMRGWRRPRKKKRGENHVKNPGQGRPKKKTVEEPRQKNIREAALVCTLPVQTAQVREHRRACLL
jgi:hypothetical protein